MKKILVGLIKIYRLFISPTLTRSCRFYPSCSAYALEAVEKHGVAAGSFKAIDRIFRCHPFNPGGYDPVPPVWHDPVPPVWHDTVPPLRADIPATTRQQ